MYIYNICEPYFLVTLSSNILGFTSQYIQQNVNNPLQESPQKEKGGVEIHPLTNINESQDSEHIYCIYKYLGIL